MHASWRRRHVTRHIPPPQNIHPHGNKTTAPLTFAAQNMAPRGSDPLQVDFSAGLQRSRRSQYVPAG